MNNALEKLFSLTDFLPHEHCFLQNKYTLLWFIIGNLGIALAYFAIPAYLLTFVLRHKDKINGYKSILVLFATFIISCGITHGFSIIGLWYPYYRLEALWSVWTASVSIATIFVLHKIVSTVKVNHYILEKTHQEAVEIELPPKALK